MARITRRAKIKLLLQTLLDASSPGRSTSDVRAAFGSRPPAKSELWEQGSYHALYRCLDALKAQSNSDDPKWRGVYWHTWCRYVTGDTLKTDDLWKSEKGLTFLEETMPSDVFVPQEVSENAGHSPSDSKAAARRRRAA